MNIEDFKEVLLGSKEFYFEYGDEGSTVLVLKGYYTGKEIKIDLSRINDDMFKELVVEEGEE